MFTSVLIFFKDIAILSPVFQQRIETQTRKEDSNNNRRREADCTFSACCQSCQLFPFRKMCLAAYSVQRFQRFCLASHISPFLASLSWRWPSKYFVRKIAFGLLLQLLDV